MWAKHRRDEAVREVVRVSVDAARLINDIEIMQAELVRRRVELRFLHNKGLVADADAKRARSALLDVDLPGNAEHKDYDRHPDHAAWKNAVDALARDADAVLPDA